MLEFRHCAAPVTGTVRPDRPMTASVSRPAGRTAAIRVLALACALAAAGCSSNKTEALNPNASAERLYSDAKAEMNAGNWEQAIKTLERVEVPANEQQQAIATVEIAAIEAGIGGKTVLIDPLHDEDSLSS